MNSKKNIILIIGLGYVGLPLAIEFAKKNYYVVGFDINEVRIKNLQKGLISNEGHKKEILKFKQLKFVTNITDLQM